VVRVGGRVWWRIGRLGGGRALRQQQRGGRHKRGSSSGSGQNDSCANSWASGSSGMTGNGTALPRTPDAVRSTRAFRAWAFRSCSFASTRSIGRVRRR
jgi:hypothetical protein